MQRLTKKYPRNGKITIDASNFTTHQEVIDSDIECSKPIKAAVERLYEYENAAESGMISLDDIKNIINAEIKDVESMHPEEDENEVTVEVIKMHYKAECKIIMQRISEFIRERKQSVIKSAESARTNYDRIKNMSIEGMAEFLSETIEDCEACPSTKICFRRTDCINNIHTWLKSEAEE